MLKILLPLAVTVCLVPAMADSFTYVDWTSATSDTVSGSIGSITVDYSGELSFAQTGSDSSPWAGYDPTSTFESALVANAPSDDQIIAITGAPGYTDTITFSTPVTNLIMDLVSLGNVNTPTEYTFDSPFTILSTGPSNEYGGGLDSLTASNGNETVTGAEGDGTILFNGPITTLSWTASNPEYWNGFTFGIDDDQLSDAPEPSSWMVMATGLLILVAMRRRVLARR
jgi:hypothetical protein